MGEALTLPKDSDSRLKGFFGQVTHPTLSLQRTYCFLCGKPWGYASTESSQHVRPEHILVTCDDCDIAFAEKYGTGAVPVPQHLYDAYGLIPEAVEIGQS